MSVTLVPVTVAQARAVVAGDLSVVTAARGWPHADTLDALRPLAAADPAADADADATGTFWVVLDGVVIGECGWYGPPGPDGEVEIGYGLAAPSRGRGHGGAAVRALVEWVAGQPGVRRIVAGAEADNTPSRRVLERLGFTLVTADEKAVRYALAVAAAEPAAAT